MSSEATRLDLEYECVRCALCGENNAKVKFTVSTQDTTLSSVWIDGVRYQPKEMGTIVVCRTCGLVYVNPRLASKPNVVTYSMEQEQVYFERSRETRLLAYRDLIRQLPIWLGQPPRTLLDIGCGDGALVEAACQAGIESAGTEISDTLIHLVRERLGKDAIVSCDLDELPATHYDIITLINVLEHLRTPSEILSASSRLLKPDGILLVHAPNLGGLPARLQGARWHQIEPLEHFYYFTTKTLKALLRRTGFEPVARFNLVVSRGLRGQVQRSLGRMGVYLDNGLGIVARCSLYANGVPSDARGGQ